MEAYLLDWLSLLVRWTHVIVGIAWIGASFYFVWLDNHLLAPTDETLKNKGVGGELWAVHGGGFYNPQKYKLAPTQIPEHLHWFYWEAYSTWLSGFLLLSLLYYVSPEIYLIDPAVADLGRWTAVGIGIGTLAGGWLIYDLLCRSPIGKNLNLLAAVLAVLLAASAFGLCSVFSGRGAYLHFGAMLGTIMVGNVFFVIIPGQRAMVAASQAGLPPDPANALRAKQRSVHNTYFTLPVLLTMISNHYAMTYGAHHNALVLIALTFAGAAIRVWFVERHKAHERGGRTSPLAAIAGVAAILVVIAGLRPVPPASAAAGATSVSFAQVQTIIQTRCASCHAEHPTQPGFFAPPKGHMLDTPARILAQKAEIRQQVGSRAMPIGNLTQMSDDERIAVLAWIDAGAPQ
ncbi:MAG: hypothetical protein JWQ90_4190 [Hydrocarboniphaga sp.]|uniref:urate hydroxylase PuuD n=1 Tax=Hydrocarboniphaga sp. TaxID=2033016 RepID=UPI00262C97CA|nr:urate hydroxylase PuuD [Hydrocarboniphaga sp.]MDB5971740.1 hypothetical protein [Hydrocarboniphaga sp.]